MTAIAGSVWTAAQWNTHIRDALNATATAKATTPGAYFTTGATRAVSERQGVSALTTDLDTTTNTDYGDLEETTGPRVSPFTGESALVMVQTSVGATTSSGASARMSFTVISGETTIEPTDERACGKIGTSTDFSIIGGHLSLVTGLTSGPNTFQAKYRVSSGTATFDNRRIAVLPL